MAPGTYYIGAIADPGDAVQESDETNNTLVGNQITIIGPDVYMTSVGGPGSALTGEAVTISDTVMASADGGTAVGFSVGFYLSTDSVITTSDMQIGGRYVAGLLAGLDDNADTTVTIPGNLASGTYYIGAIADYDDQVPENDETNNALVGNQIEVTRVYPDIIMTAVSGPASAKTEENIAVTYTVKNQGLAPMPGVTYGGIYLSADAAVTTDDFRLKVINMPNLAAGAESTDSVALTIASGIEPGTYYIGVIADIYDGVTESDETNNSLAGNQITVTGPDLFMTSVSGPTSAFIGDAVTITETVAAAADGGGVTEAYVTLYLSTDDVIDTSDIYLGYRAANNLAAGASDSAGTAVTIPSNVAPGTYYIGAIADGFNNAKEYDETNNALAGNQIAIFSADLMITAVSGPTSANAGQSITISHTLAASAAYRDAPSSTTGFYLSADSVISTSDILIGSRSEAGLMAGESRSSDTQVTVPAGLEAGTYYIGAIADYQDGLYEPDEANNAMAGNQITIANPDLLITAVSGPASGYPGSMITISHTLAARAAHGDAPGSTTGFYLSTDNVITTSDILIGSRSEPALAAGESISADTQVTIPTGTALGTYYIGAVADYADSVYEPDETNNALAGNQITVNAPTPPDLIMSAVSYAGSAPRGSAVTVSNTVSNIGGQPAGYFDIGFYLSTDPVETPDDRFLGYRGVSSLAPGASNSADTAITIPSDVAPGTYYIIAYADDCEVSWDEYLGCIIWIDESNENNNDLAGGQITIILP